MRPRTGVGIIVAACVFATAHHAGAGEVRKCGSQDGRHSYVSGACPAGTREIWSRTVEAEPVSDDDRQQRLAELNRWQQAGRQRMSTSRGTGRRPQRQADTAAQACETAKRRRDEIRDRDWYTITFEQLSALDERVARACR